MRLRLAYPLLAATVLLPATGHRMAAQDVNTAMLRRGETLLTTNCAPCHAVGRTGDSPRPDAPTFRSLSKKYPIETLAESLAEGLFTGHPDMPEFTFEAPDVGAIIAYLESIQER
jgi:mono/diheme cytochrome c family protein